MCPHSRTPRFGRRALPATRRFRAWWVWLVLAACKGNEPLPVVVPAGDLRGTISPDGLWVAFEHTDSTDPGSLYIAKLDGSQRQLLRAGALWPDWSPDGLTIAATLGATIIRITVATGAFTAVVADACCGAFSPNGLTLAFSGSGGTAFPPDLWTVPSSGGTPTRVPLPGPPHDELAGPSWSSDGTRLAATRFSGRAALFITNLAGTDSTVIGVSGLDLTRPSWSPLGNRIAYVRSSAGQAGEIWLVNPDGSAHKRLAVNGAHPRWFPDGGRLLFSRLSGAELSLWSVDTLGQQLTRLWTLP